MQPSMKRFVNLFITAATLFYASTADASPIEQNSKSPADYVNPFIGASSSIGLAGVYHGLGKTFPGATTPFGMAQTTPNTISGGDNASGYSYELQTFEGFTVNQMSGVGWYGDLANFMVMPTTGPLQIIAGKEDNSIKGYRSHFDKATEHAEAGYYSVHLSDYNIKAEGTATPRCSYMRFTFPENALSRIQIDLAHRAGGTSIEQAVNVVDNRTIEGNIVCTPDGGGWGDGHGNVSYTLYFHAELSRPMKDWGIWSAEIPDNASRHLGDVYTPEYQQIIASAPISRQSRGATGKHLGFFTEFPTKEGEVVELKVGISYVDIEGARKNFNAEIADHDFNTIRQKTHDMWNSALSAITVSGNHDDDQLTTFYTALYHTMIDPRIANDVDGRYVGGDGQIKPATDTFVKRTIFSGWDVFRSQFPLLNLIRADVVHDQIHSLITLAEESGREYFERWELMNSYSGCMLGNPALPVIADAYVKGIRDFDVDKAIRYGINSSIKLGNDTTLGYYPEPLSISNTLEYAYADWALGALAEAAGMTEIAAEYKAKGEAYRNVFNKEVGWFCPRNANGTWAQWKENARLEEWFGCIESNLLQQGWFVPHNFEGMRELMGDTATIVADLEQMFENSPQDLMWNKYYNHSNEPVHFVPFLFNKLGHPWLTQKWTRHICKNAYSNGIDGLVGNEDAGQMSAWYVLTAIGIHPSCPGDNRMEITSPVFDRAEITLDKKYHGGAKFTIIAHNNSPENIYIERALLNGKPYSNCYIDFSDIAAGSTLELFMSPTPAQPTH